MYRNTQHTCSLGRVYARIIPPKATLHEIDANLTITIPNGQFAARGLGYERLLVEALVGTLPLPCKCCVSHWMCDTLVSLLYFAGIQSVSYK